MADNPSELMACFVELSSNKERTTLEQSVVKTLCQLLNCEIHLIHLYNSRMELFPEVRLYGKPGGDVCFDERELEQVSPNMAQRIRDYLKQLQSLPADAIYNQGKQLFWPLFSGDTCIDLLILDHQPNSELDMKLVSAISRIFSNFLVLLDASERDALTGLYNRRMFDTKLSSLIRATINATNSEHERRLHLPNTSNFLGIIDIDFFKRVNDNFGHLFGDEVLLWLAQHMRQCFRNEDALFRYGGEEFAVLLTGLTQTQAMDTFERFRNTIAMTHFPQIGQITVSIGFAHIDHQANPTLVFGIADRALYYAKANGRNQVACYQRLIANKSIIEDLSDKDNIELF